MTPPPANQLVQAEIDKSKKASKPAKSKPPPTRYFVLVPTLFSCLTSLSCQSQQSPRSQTPVSLTEYLRVLICCCRTDAFSPSTGSTPPGPPSSEARYVVDYLYVPWLVDAFKFQVLPANSPSALLMSTMILLFLRETGMCSQRHSLTALAYDGSFT